MPSSRVLLIAPYPEMEPVALEVAREFRDMDLTVLVGDLESGLAATLSSYHANYDVIISRGGTAQVLEEQISLPVIEIELSALDVMRQIRALKLEGSRIAVVGFTNTIGGLERARELFSAQLDFFGIDFADEAALAVRAIRSGGYDHVLCDNISHEVAREMGISAHLLASGADSIRSAFELAVFYCAHWHLERERSRMLWDITRNHARSLVLYLHGGGLFYSNLKSEDRALYPFLESHLYDTHERHLVFRNGGIVYNVRPFQITSTEEPIVGFSINAHREPALAHPGITHENAEDVRAAVASSFLVRAGFDTGYATVIAEAAQGARPVFVRGEPGTGKARIAQLVYLASDYVTTPLVTVDLELVGERCMRYLTESYHSPLYEGSQAILLRGVQALSDTRWRTLLVSLMESGATRRNLMLITGNDSSSGAQSEAGMVMSDRLRCLVLETRAVREDGEALLNAADRYLSSLRDPNAPASPPISADAQDRLLAASWPFNHAQLARVLDRAHALAGDETVTAAQLARAVGHEEISGASSALLDREGIDLLKPLAKTEREIAALAVMRCEGNKSLAARTLGISRTTLWRLLREEAT